MNKIIGIDAGSTTVSAVILDHNKNIIKTYYQFHQGLVRKTIIELLSDIDFSKIDAVGITTSTPDMIPDIPRYDNQIAIIEAAKYYHPDLRGILVVGGEQFGLIRFDQDGHYKSYKTNTSCAAGTGSFLDQQAKRLNLEDAKSLSAIAIKNIEEIPKIATRCSVFAKTDLIHAQQEGYTLGQISDGLAHGLTKNITDTLFSDEKPPIPLLFAGGVSKNMAVCGHLKDILKTDLVIDQNAHIFDAIGVAILMIDEQNKSPQFKKSEELFLPKKSEKEYGYEPLQLKLSKYPKFDTIASTLFTPTNPEATPIESDLYKKITDAKQLYMGIDIGSTSTKSILIDQHKEVIAGFYTRTSGQPIIAIQGIFEAMIDMGKEYQLPLDKIAGVTTTGSGRKFIGKIIKADIMIDEITAHARAAFELDPEVNTIIEIGGQDAKFTTLKNGMVTSSVMNNVCAAGTGSFIEEQAQKLNTPLPVYAERAEQARAPISSDRCTVYMERDINHYLNEGYTVNEVLASVLHSVRDNYLSKVAVEGNIGNKIFFQGATARNRALVAAFEQKLQKPIIVSKYCHLTGALGGALIALEGDLPKTTFHGLDIYKAKIPIKNEVCTLCNNNCKIKTVNVNGEITAFGFLCGRDYDTKKYVKEAKNSFDLVKTYQKTLRPDNYPDQFKSEQKVVIPGTLNMIDEGRMWEHFFNALGIPVEITYNLKDPVKAGKKVTGAEFCAPIYSFHGHVKILSERDPDSILFLPVYLESKKSTKNEMRQFCYYTQFITPLITASKGLDLPRERILDPMISKGSFKTKIELYKRLKERFNVSYWAVATAYENAMTYYNGQKEQLKKIYQREHSQDQIDILMLGRPYTVLDPVMNKGIPDIFARQGLKTFFQEMLTYEKKDVAEIEELLKSFHWNYTATILEAAHVAAKTDGLYPVYISSFKCGPDAFALQYFKRIMEKANKPYLILELDEHDSSVGYETRIEAGIRAFQNHYAKKETLPPVKNPLPVNPILAQAVKGKKLLFPSWDDLSSSLIVAILKGHGFDVEMVPLTEETIQVGPRNNTGQCLPVSLMAQSFIEYIEKHDLDRENTVVWTIDAIIACNIRLYPHLIKTIFEDHGNGMEKVDVYAGEITMIDLSLQVSINLYFAFMFAGMIRKVGTKIRPYEIQKGVTDRAIGRAQEILYHAFLLKADLELALRQVINLFKEIKIKKTDRPKVAILGDLYVRDNELFNQNLIKDIEAAGGEAVTTPYNEYLRMVVNPYLKRWIKLGFYKDAISIKALATLAGQMEKKYYKLFNEVLDDEQYSFTSNIQKTLQPYGVTLAHAGESFDNLIKVKELTLHDPSIALFVLANPAFCCAGAITEAMSGKIEEETGVPVVPLNYDGTRNEQNRKIIPYIKYALSKKDSEKVD